MRTAFFSETLHGNDLPADFSPQMLRFPIVIVLLLTQFGAARGQPIQLVGQNHIVAEQVLDGRAVVSPASSWGAEQRRFLEMSGRIMKAAEWVMGIEIYAHEIARVTIPDDFELGWISRTNLHEFVPHGETVENWTKMFSFVVVSHQSVTVEQFRDNVRSNFFKACRKKGRLSADLPARTENSLQVIEWVQSCKIAKSGPSKGKPETNIFKYVQGKDTDLLVNVAFRYIPTAEEVDTWRIFLNKTTLRSN